MKHSETADENKGYSRRQALSVLASASLFAKPEDQNGASALTETHGYLNGRTWVKLNDSGKLWLVYGIHDGTTSAFAVAVAKVETDSIAVKKIEALGKFWQASFSYGEVVREIDRFYKEPANAVIPVAIAFAFALRRLRGEPASSMEDAASELRRIYSSGK